MGLTHVQGFTQDDAHIFCTPEQLVDEINGVIDFVADTMKIFNMEFEVELSTRPESFVGEIENWDKAEALLKKAGIDVRVAKKEFLPTINISGLALFNSINLYKAVGAKY
ncbi:hypothetical protein J6O48_10850 [bacterium]|nr:hypothetical protein [bacterium]